MWRALRLGLAACLLAGVAHAQQAPLIPVNKGFHGPGSPGFLPTCSSTFQVTNYVEGTDNTQIGVAPWTLTSGGGASAPTITSTTDTAPDGTATAVDVSFGAISGTTQYSLLSEGVGTSVFANFYNWTQQAWVRVITPPATGNFSLSIYDNGSQGPLAGGQSYVTSKIPNDGKWYKLANYIPANWTGSTAQGHTAIFQLGPDGRDVNHQPSTVSAGVVAIWQPQFAQGHSEGGKGWPFVRNSSTSAPSAVSEFTLQCPSTIAFRDFGPMRTWFMGNSTSINPNYNPSSGTVQITKQDATAGSGGIGLYEQGGIGNPFGGDISTLETSGPYAGQFIGFSSTTDGTSQTAPATHNDWPASVLIACKTIFTCTEATKGSPQLLIPGYILPATGATLGGTPPCSATCAPTTGTTVTAPNVSMASNGVVTITMPSAINFGPGANLVVSGFSVTGNAVNGNFLAIAPTSGTTITYQSACTSGCASTVNSSGTVNWSVPWNSYTLHGSWVPRNSNGVAATVNGVSYKYGMMFSAEATPNGGGIMNTFLAYSNSPDSGYCVYNQFFPANCNNGSPTAGGTSTPANAQPTGVLTSINAAVGSGQLPTLICLPVGCPATGGTLYAISPPTNQAQMGFTLWQSTPGLATSWNYAGWITQPPYTSSPGPADWDYISGSSRIDPHIHLNKCGFFEFAWTSYSGVGWEGPFTTNKFDQAISVAVATDIRGPYYRLQNAYFSPIGNGAGLVTGPTGSLFPFKQTGTVYNGGTTAGETYFFEDDYGTLYWTGNTDNGSNKSSGVVAYMHDYCQ